MRTGRRILRPADLATGHPQRPRITHGALPGKNRRQKRLNAKAAQRAFVANRRAAA